jgi:DNA repair exonuclease SbcCD ATPase subunit
LLRNVIVIPRRVELTNFLSFGDKQTLEFTDDEPLWVLSGPNGVGKSAVFDAITFALFGSHRGGSQNADELIRHGANHFLVVFEFEFNGKCYAIHRGRTKKSVQRVLNLVGTTWEDIDLSHYSARDKIRTWAEETLGLDYNAFTASVMLRQGEADRIITSEPSQRREFLSKIIGAERYKRLYERVKAATSNLKNQVENLTAQLEHTPEVTSEQLREAATQLEQATMHRADCRAKRDAALTRIEQARRWNELERERTNLEQRIHEANTRAAEAESIQRAHERLLELQQVLPPAWELVELRDQLTQLTEEMNRLNDEVAAADAARDQASQKARTARQQAQDYQRQMETSHREVQQLRQQIAQTRGFIQLADELAALEERYRQFPVDLEVQVRAAEAEVRRWTEARRVAGERRAAANGLLQAAERRRRDFEQVEVGVRCYRCGQPVSEEHARRERAELDAEISRCRQELDQARRDEQAANTSHATASQQHSELQNVLRDRDSVHSQLQQHRRNLAIQGVTADAAAMRATLDELQQRLATLEVAAANALRTQREMEEAAEQLEAEYQRLAAQARHFETQRQTARTTQASLTAQQSTLLRQLPTQWAERLPGLTRDELAHCETELQQYRRDDISGRFRQLQDDAARRDEWNRRHTQLLTELDQIPIAARCSLAEAQLAETIAQQQVQDAEAAYTAARDRDAELRRHFDRRCQLSIQHRDQDREYRLHDQLTQLLGPEGLQREVIRSAERQIVRFANDTVRNLSHGDLTIELDPADEGPDKALTLLVRRADDPVPIGVKFLSGSQRFRVAVAVALAIGRFAAGQTRPLQSVIIDEGFGSLDREGLQAMGDELWNLQQSQSLKRLILVSHQEEFTARFPVGYQLQATGTGTIACRFRREAGSIG